MDEEIKNARINPETAEKLARLDVFEAEVAQMKNERTQLEKERASINAVRASLKKEQKSRRDLCNNNTIRGRTRSHEARSTRAGRAAHPRN